MSNLKNVALNILAVLLIKSSNINCDESAKVVIIGAGSAGIAAASKLYENGFTDMLILEAEDRIGGRIYSTEFEGSTIDLGAEFCHGEKDNIVYEMAHGYNLLTPINLDLGLYHSSRTTIDHYFTQKIVLQLLSFYEDPVSTPENMSVGEYITIRFEKEILEPLKDDENKSKAAKEIFAFFQSSLLSYTGAFSVFTLSSQTNFEDSDGNQHILWKSGGYKTMLDILLRKYPDADNEMPIIANKTLFNKEVNKILWNYTDPDNSVIVKCSDGSVYKADHVIFTPSLGVLKNTYEDMFDPRLPLEKINAIHNLGMGSIIKIHVHFLKQWWPDEEGAYFGLIWSEEDIKQSLIEFPYGPIRNGRSWLHDVSQFTGLQRNSSILVLWAAGELSTEIENLHDHVLIDGITYLLQRFFGKKYPGFTKPDKIMRNNWYSNPHFYGTYSYEAVKSDETRIESLNKLLEKPLVSSTGKLDVLFAGEATSLPHYSVVHGAIETGFREAYRVLQSYL